MKSSAKVRKIIDIHKIYVHFICISQKKAVTLRSKFNSVYYRLGAWGDKILKRK